jgi:hypothetical protein
MRLPIVRFRHHDAVGLVVELEVAPGRVLTVARRERPAVRRRVALAPSVPDPCTPAARIHSDGAA